MTATPKIAVHRGRVAAREPQLSRAPCREEHIRVLRSVFKGVRAGGETDSEGVITRLTAGAIQSYPDIDWTPMLLGNSGE
jgi:hypothetical protein